MATKDVVDSIPAERPISQDAFANRKLIRPSLNRNEHGHNNHNHMTNSMSDRPRPERSAERADRGTAPGRKVTPPDQTNAENFYYQKQMQARTPMVVVLSDGEEVHGIIEWYDRNCIKLNRNGVPNVMIYKPAIKYMYKEGENSKKS
jgi:host factor-I protein